MKELLLHWGCVFQDGLFLASLQVGVWEQLQADWSEGLEVQAENKERMRKNGGKHFWGERGVD